MDYVGKARRFAERTTMNAAMRFSKPLRGADRPPQDHLGLIDLLGIYDLGDGLSSFRFAVVLPPEIEPKLQILGMRGNVLSVPMNMLTHSCARGDASGPEPMVYVVSVVLPTDIRGFFAVVQGAGVYRYYYPVEKPAVVIERDILMCNPGIDGLYGAWAASRPSDEAVDDIGQLQLQPLMSVVTPVFNTPIRYIRELTDAMRSQTYPHWEHILVNASPDNQELTAFLHDLDDPRFRVIDLEENKGIAGNSLIGIEASTGDYISFVDHDDVIDARILEEYVRAINVELGADLLYCDEDTLSEDGTVRSEPIFKPGLNRDLLSSWNYVLHMLTVSRRAYDKVEPYGDDVSGSQDYDLTLKICSVADRVVRIPKVLYHWRENAGSFSHTGTAQVDARLFEPSMLAIRRHYESEGIDVEVAPRDITWLYRTSYVPSNACDVSLVVNVHDERSYGALLTSLETQRASIVLETLPVRDGMLNETIQAARGAYIVLVDDAMTFMDGFDALGHLRDALARPDLGIVSAKALTPEGLNLHAGLCVKSDGTFGYLNQGFVQGMGGGYNGCAESQCDYSAVDLTCVAFRKADFEAVGGLSVGYDTDLARAIDFSFRIRELGKLIMVDPDARVISRACPEQLYLGYSHLSDQPNDLERLWSRWGNEYRTDVLANPNYTLDNSYFNLNVDEATMELMRVMEEGPTARTS